MTARLSPRLAAIVDALPLEPGLRVLEVGCGPGAAAREVARRLGPHGHLLAVDRSVAAVHQARRTCADLIASGRLDVRNVAVEDLELGPGEPRYDLAFAVRVGVLDGRHPTGRSAALERLARAVVPGGCLYVDTGSPLDAIALPLPGAATGEP